MELWEVPAYKGPCLRGCCTRYSTGIPHGTDQRAPPHVLVARHAQRGVHPSTVCAAQCNVPLLTCSSRGMRSAVCSTARSSVQLMCSPANMAFILVRSLARSARLSSSCRVEQGGAGRGGAGLAGSGMAGTRAGSGDAHRKATGTRRLVCAGTCRQGQGAAGIPWHACCTLPPSALAFASKPVRDRRLRVPMNASPCRPQPPLPPTTVRCFCF